LERRLEGQRETHAIVIRALSPSGRMRFRAEEGFQAKT
jgi:hypothetical protein